MAEPEKCPVCAENPRQPRLLFCNHVLCKECVDDLLKDTTVTVGENDRAILCPTCRNPSLLPRFSTADSLRPVVAESLLRRVGHGDSRPVASLDARCTKHSHIADIFCEDCVMTTCRECASTDHATHSYDPIDTVVTRHRQQVGSYMKMLEQKICSVLDNFTNLNIQEKEIIEQGDVILSEIDAYIKEVIEAIQKAVDELKRQVHKEINRKVQVVSKRKDINGISLKKMMSCAAYVEDKLENESQLEILLGKNEMIEALRAACEKSTERELQVEERLNIVFQPSYDILQNCSKIGEISAVELPTTDSDMIYRANQKDTSQYEDEQVDEVDSHCDLPKGIHSLSVATICQQIAETEKEQEIFDTSTTSSIALDALNSTVALTDDSITVSREYNSADSRVAIVGRPRSITLQLCNIEVSGLLSCHLIPQGGGKVVKSHISQLEQDRCCITFTPSQEGLHQVMLQDEGANVSHDLCTILVLPIPKTKCQQVRATEKLRQSTGLALASSRHLLVTELFGKVVAVLDKEGCLMKRFEHGGGDYPSSVATMPDNQLIVLSQNAPHVTKYSADYALVGMANSCHGKGPLQFDCPRGIAVTNSHIYVCDTGNYRIQVLNPDLTFSHKFGKKGSEPGEFNTPYGIVTDSQDTLYVCDYGNDRVQKLTSSGDCITEFKVSMPMWIAIDSDIVLYIISYSDSKFSLLMYDVDGGYLGRKEVPQNDRYVGVAVDHQYLYLAKEMEVVVFTK